jgi:hypothetical protein
MSQTFNDWINNITIQKLLNYAPHGFLCGCGGTSEYLAFVMRSRSSSEKDLFEVIRQGYYYDSIVDEVEYSFENFSLAIEEIEKRLDIHSYVRVSFCNLSNNDSSDNSYSTPDEVRKSIINCILDPPSPVLFDHSFIIVKYNGIWRLESYVGLYKPRAIQWDSYHQDLQTLFESPIKEWKRLFEADCNPDYDPSQITILISH